MTETCLPVPAIVGKSAEAEERRLVPEVIEQFFVSAAPETGLQPKPLDGKPTAGTTCAVYRIGKVPRHLVQIGDRQEERFGRLGREYGKIVFDKEHLKADATLEWVTPGHPLFECIRTDVLTRTDDALVRHLQLRRRAATAHNPEPGDARLAVEHYQVGPQVIVAGDSPDGHA